MNSIRQTRVHTEKNTHTSVCPQTYVDRFRNSVHVGKPIPKIEDVIAKPSDSLDCTLSTKLDNCLMCCVEMGEGRFT